MKENEHDNNKDFIKAVGYVDDSIVERYLRVEEEIDITARKKERSRILWRKAVVCAACVALVIMSVVTVAFYVSDGGLNGGFFKGDKNEATEDEENDIMYTGAVDTTPAHILDSVNYSLEEVLDIPREMIAVEAILYNISNSKYSSYVSASVIDEKYVGEKIGDVSIRAFWRNFLNKTDSDEEILDAVVYSIKGVDSNAAVCVKYISESKKVNEQCYYTFVNSIVDSGSRISDVYSSFDAQSYMSVRDGVTIYSTKDSINVYTTYELGSETAEKVKNSLISLEGEMVEYTEEELDSIIGECDVQTRIRVDIISAGVHNMLVVVLDNGYLLQTVGERVYLFDIGDSANDIMRTVLNEGSVKTYHDGDHISAVTSYIE